MTLSIIVPTYNSEKTIEPCLAAIRNSNDKDYEVVVVEDGSTDGRTLAIAKKYADLVIEHEENLGRSHARSTGIQHAKGEILLFIDSDVVIRPDTIGKIKDYFARNEGVDALSGLLSKEHPHPGFFSQYKNLYMNYIFSRLPERINFLYGSVHAVRRRALLSYDSAGVRIADDTALGQKLVHEGRRLAFLKDLEVAHLKSYNFFSFIRNDFRIPYDWAKIFVRYRGWRQLGQNGAGYLHSPREQLFSVALVPLISLLEGGAVFWPALGLFAEVLFVLWIFLNIPFLTFLAKERGFLFGLRAFFVTFLDHGVMATGIACGLVRSLWNQLFP